MGFALRERNHRRITALCLVLLTVIGCSVGGEDVTTRSLTAARRLWDKAGLRDYNLEWTSSGARDGHYLVFVRDSNVKVIRSIQPNGSQIELKPADLSYYGVEGLFRVIEEELAQTLDDAPFGLPKGTRAILKFTYDSQTGYPKRYRRDVVGSPKGLSIDVLKFEPRPGSEIPPPTQSSSEDKSQQAVRSGSGNSS